MKKSTKRLYLDRQTIAHLTHADLGRAQGGMPPATASKCLDKGCTIGLPTKTGCVTRTQDCV
jgi:hypothetical protein